jgi:hypothetical protein
MLEGGGGGISGTNWNVHEMETMWLALANQETTEHWKLLTGWRTSYELALQHLSDVKRYRDDLATAWPPEKSPAAAAYVEQLNGLINYLQSTYDAAIANYTAFSSATLALAESRRKLKDLYDQYVTNQGKINDFNVKKSKPIGGLSGAAAQKNLKPPVTDQQQQDLTWQARSIMFGLSSEVSQAQTAMTKPAAYNPAFIVDGKKKEKGGGSYTPPALPPIFASPESSSPQSTSSAGGSRLAPTVGSIPSSVSPHPGLVLGGTTPTPATAPAIPGPGFPPGTPISPGGPINPVVGLPTLPTTTNLPSSSVNVPQSMQSGGMARPGSSGMPPGAMRSMPPGGVIGGMNGPGLGQTGGRSAQRVNPFGGVITPGSNGGQRPGTNGGPKGAAPFGSMGGRPNHDDGGGSEKAKWDPENPWKMDDGVAPIVLPSSEQRIDPGPAIGFDR